MTSQRSATGGAESGPGPGEPRRARRAVFLTWRDSTHPEGGGSELFVERVAAQLVQRGWSVTICCAAHDNAPADETRDGVHFRRRGGRLGVYARGFAYLLGSGRKADVVVDVQNGVPFFAPLARRRGVLALVHHVHREQWQIIYPGRVGRLGWWIESRLAPRVYRRCPYVTVSDATRANLVALGIAEERISVVHNGIDAPHPDRVVPRAHVPTVCVLGRLVPHKQVEHALLAVAALRAGIPGLRLEIVGAGWWEPQLVALATELDLDECVTFHGHVPDELRDRLLDRSWLLVTPSVKEGWGIAIMEAAARGVPAIAYRSAGGVRESIVDGETGWLVDDRDELTKRVEELLRDAAVRNALGENARRRATAYTWTSTGAAFSDVLDRTVAAGRPPLTS